MAGPNKAIAQQGGFKLLIHDAPPPGNIDAIYLTVVSVDAVKQDGGIINLSNKPTAFNLLNYREGNPLELVNKVIPSGRYAEIRLKLNEDNSIVVAGQTKPLKTPSAQQSGVKLKGHFEIVEGLLYTMRLHFDPNKSIVYNPGPDRYILKPVIEITGNSLVDGNFTVAGLIENESVVAELKADGTLRLIGTFDPRIELRGRYYFNYGTRMLSLELDEVFCSTCAGVGAIPGGIFYNMPDSAITVSYWSSTSIVGSIGSGLFSRAVLFTETDSFVLAFQQTYSTLKIVVVYPNSGYNDKFGVLTLMPKSIPGKSFMDMQKIISQTASFTLKIPFAELPGGIPNGNKDFVARLVVATDTTDLKVSAQSHSSICGDIELSNINYVINVPVADKVLTTNVHFSPAS